VQLVRNGIRHRPQLVAGRRGWGMPLGSGLLNEELQKEPCVPRSAQSQTREFAHMDPIRETMDLLRALALQSSDQNVYLLVEQEIARYLANPAASLTPLKEAVDTEADTSQHHTTFWTTPREFLSHPALDR
jgi:hypothetical protein